MWTEILLSLIVLVLLACVSSLKKPSGIPPGLWGWPFIGVLPSSDIPLGNQVSELRKKYGDIISWRMGSQLFIFFCDYKMIKTVFTRAETADRPPYYSFKAFTEFFEAGVGTTNGRVWVNNRRFALQHLKQLGMGKTHLGEAIKQEAQILVKDFKKQLNRPVDLPWSINVAVLNVIWQMVAGIRYDINDEKIIRLHKLLNDALAAFDGPVMWLDIYPNLVNFLPFWLRTKLGMNSIYENAKIIRTFIQEEVLDQHVKNLDRDNPKDYIDSYLVEMEKRKNDPESTMSMDDLTYGLIDFFGDGTSTVSATTKWTVFFLAKYPEIQKRVQKEIDSVVPRDELPSLEHRDRLPYVDAFIHEVMRVSSVAPLGGPHANYAEMELDGYRIPKGSVLIGNLEACHKDPRYWEKPNEFYPEHFLDENGKFYVRKEGFMPFGTGRRLCIGEALARMELFYFITALIQNFTFSPPDGEKLSEEKSTAERIFAFPSSFKMMIAERT
ncbi:cytochrome P450 2L1-like [Palaemon carinicauda]|uniref:cytochrome P450 2L1-like n=1 Tax=Palaemon carinicauda TaxID=392227 RepID=UPI0035B5D0C9